MKLVLLLLLLISCSRRVYPEQFKYAEKLCKDNNGLLAVNVYDAGMIVECKNEMLREVTGSEFESLTDPCRNLKVCM